VVVILPILLTVSVNHNAPSGHEPCAEIRVVCPLEIGRRGEVERAYHLGSRNPPDLGRRSVNHSAPSGPGLSRSGFEPTVAELVTVPGGNPDIALVPPTYHSAPIGASGYLGTFDDGTGNSVNSPVVVILLIFCH
jgi:hypothetical protein